MEKENRKRRSVSSTRGNLVSEKRMSHTPPKNSLAKPFIDINDLEGSADALRALADQLDSMQSHRETRNLAAYTLPRGHFVKRVIEQTPEEDSPGSKSKHAKSKKQDSHDSEDEEDSDDADSDDADSDDTDQDDENESTDEDDDKDKDSRKRKASKQNDDSDEDSDESADESNDDHDQEDDRESDDSGKTSHANKSGKDGDSEKSKKKKKFKFTPKRIAAMAIVLFILLGAAGIFLYQMHTYESTDDATVQAHTALLAPKVSGIVTQVLVDEHQRVKAGQVLVRIEPKDFNANLDNSRATLESMKVQLRNAKRDLERSKLLARDHAITDQDYDHALANYQELDRKTRAAMSDVDESELNLAYTEIRAPTDGMIGRKSVEVGMNASAGTALMGFVQDDERWVIANFKETQLSSIKPGKKVKVEVDAISGRDYEGIVESISPSSGATFTLFPPDNATGNFTKVVQRVPVKIYLKNLSENDIENLQAGLSAVVSVYKQSETEAIPARPFLNYRAQIASSLPGEDGERSDQTDQSDKKVTQRVQYGNRSTSAHRRNSVSSDNATTPESANARNESSLNHQEAQEIPPGEKKADSSLNQQPRKKSANPDQTSIQKSPISESILEEERREHLFQTGEN